MKWMFTACVLAWSISAASAADVEWLNGTKFQQFPEQFQVAYVMGTLSATAFHGEAMHSKMLNECLVGKSPKQLHAVVLKHLAQNPEKWDLPVSVVINTAIAKMCAES